MSPRVGDEERKSTKDVTSGNLSASLDRDWIVPITFKIGGMSKKAEHTFRNETAYHNWRYDGPGGGSTGNFGAYPSRFVNDLSLLGAEITSIGGGSVTFADHQAIRTPFLEHPEYFTHIGTPANYYTAFVENRRSAVREGTTISFPVLRRSTRSAEISRRTSDIAGRSAGPRSRT